MATVIGIFEEKVYKEPTINCSQARNPNEKIYTYR